MLTRCRFTASKKSSAPSPMSLTPTSSTCMRDRKSTRLNSSHSQISYAVFCLKKKKKKKYAAKAKVKNLHNEKERYGCVFIIISITNRDTKDAQYARYLMTANRGRHAYRRIHL